MAIARRWTSFQGGPDYQGGGFQDYGTLTDMPGNGFMSYGVGPESGMMDTQPTAFSSFFNMNGQTNRPMFDAMTDVYRAPQNALAYKASQGDPNAAAAWEKNDMTLQGISHLYEIGRAAGVNDETAAAGVKYSFRIGNQLAGKLGTSASLFMDETQKYIANQAKQRGYRVEDLASEEDQMDRAFRQSIANYRRARRGNGLGVDDPDYDNTLSTTNGFDYIASLDARKALQEIERDGLYSTADRIAVLDEMARLMDRTSSNRLLDQKFRGDTSAIAKMAADKVLRGSTQPNLFDLIDGDIASINDGLVTYTGSTHGDTSAGFAVVDKNGRRVESGLAPIIRSCLMEQAVEDRLGMTGDADRSLHDRIVGKLKARYVLPANGRQGVADTVFGAVADKIVEMHRQPGRHVDLSQLNDLFLPEAAKVKLPKDLPSVGGMKGLKALNDIGSRIIDDLVKNRPGVYGNKWSWYPNGWFGQGDRSVEKALYTDPEAVASYVEDQFRAGLNSTTSGWSAEDRVKYAGAANRYATYIGRMVYAMNTGGDDRWWTSDPKRFITDSDISNLKNYGIRSALTRISLEQNLKELGFEGVPEWVPDNKKEPRYLREKYGSRDRSYANAMSGLAEYLDKYIGSVADPKNLDDKEFVKYQTAVSYRRGIDALTKAGANADDVVGGQKALDRLSSDASVLLGIKAIEGDTVGGFADATESPLQLAAVSEAWSARQMERERKLADARALQIGAPGTAERQMLDELLREGYNDRINPVLDRKVNLMSEAFVDKYGPSLKGPQREQQLNYIRTAVSQAVNDIGANVPKQGENGEVYVAFDPMANLMMPTELTQRVEKLLFPNILSRVRMVNKTYDDMVNENLRNKTTARAEATKLVSEAAENGTLRGQASSLPVPQAI